MADRYVWTSGNGSTVLDLTDAASGLMVQAEGTRGFYNVDWDVTSSQLAGIDGVNVDAIVAKENTPVLALLMEAPNEATYVARRRALVRAMKPRQAGRRQPGTLTVFNTDGSARRLTCYVIDGLGGDQAADSELPGRWWRTALQLYAPDPWWYGDPVRTSFPLAAPSVFLSDTLPMPRALSSSSIQGGATFSLLDVDDVAYWTAVITGPGTGLTLTNVTTGKVMTVAATLDDQQQMVIDTRPGRQSVRRRPAPTVVQTEQRRNRAPNPSAEVDVTTGLTPYNSGTTGTITRSRVADPAPGGGASSFEVTAAGLAADANARAGWYFSIPVAPGEVISYAMMARLVAGSAGQRVEARIQWWTAGGAYINDVAVASTTSATYAQLKAENFTAPAGAGICYLFFYVAGSATTSGAATAHVDQVQIEKAATVGDYFDGSSLTQGPVGRPGTVSYAWLGTPGASASVQMLATASGPVDAGVSLMGAVTSDPALWPLVEGVNEVTVQLGSAGANSLVEMVYTPRYAGI